MEFKLFQTSEEDLMRKGDRIFYQKTKSNNWLKLHGYPMRRKPRGSRKKKSFFYVDELSYLFLLKVEMGKEFAKAYNQTLRYSHPVLMEQHLALPAHPEGSGHNG